jgi:hypothetical protein
MTGLFKTCPVSLLLLEGPSSIELRVDIKADKACLATYLGK